jgi:hypothetical protein
LLRLYLLRALYLLIVVGLAIEIWPGLINREKPWESMEGVVACMLGAFSALSVLGLRYPLQMLPLLLWELVWKTLWLIIIAAPLWSAGTMDEATRSVAGAVVWVVIIPFVIPWRYVFEHYVTKSGERWR